MGPARSWRTTSRCRRRISGFSGTRRHCEERLVRRRSTSGSDEAIQLSLRRPSVARMERREIRGRPLGRTFYSQKTNSVIPYLLTHIRGEVRLLLEQFVLRHPPIPDARFFLKSLRIDILSFYEVHS